MGKQAMIEAQAEKADLLQDGGEILLSPELTALAFGISLSEIKSLQQAGDVLLIEPQETGVLVSIQPETLPWRRDLWLEMLGTLEKGRSSVSEAKRAYDVLYPFTQILACEAPLTFEGFQMPKGLREFPALGELVSLVQIGQSTKEGDLGMLQSILRILWSDLTPGIQQEMAGMEPEMVLASLKIAGSGT